MPDIISDLSGLSIENDHVASAHIVFGHVAKPLLGARAVQVGQIREVVTLL